MSEYLFIGIDGGASSCRARLSDMNGNLLGEGSSGPANIHLDLDLARESIRTASRSAARAAGFEESALRRTHAGLGLAGAGLKDACDRLLAAPTPFASTEVASDAYIAWLRALVNMRLYLPRRMGQGQSPPEEMPRAAGSEVMKPHHELCLDMLAESGPLLPHSAWIAGDDELGRSSSFRRELRSRNERYLLAVPSNTLVRDLEVEVPQHAGPAGAKPRLSAPDKRARCCRSRPGRESTCATARRARWWWK